MKERPILFSAAMVRAILDGRKTQTRRAVLHEHIAEADIFSAAPVDLAGRWEFGIAGEGGVFAHGDYLRCPYGVPGDGLWVRETHYRYGHWVKVTGERRRTDTGEVLFDPPPGIRLGSAATTVTRRRPRGTSGSRDSCRARSRASRWRSPRSACSACRRSARTTRGPRASSPGRSAPTARHSSTCGSRSINGKRAPWSSNPWVWALTFRRLP